LTIKEDNLDFEFRYCRICLCGGKYSRMLLNGNSWPERLYSPSIVVFC